MFTKCFFGHDWSKWEKYELRYRTSPGRSAPVELRGKWFDALDTRQMRHCEKCGKNQDKLIRELY